MRGIAKLTKDSALGTVKNGSTKALMLQVQYGDPDDVQTSQLFPQSGEDTAPLKGARAVTLDLDGLLVTIGVWDGVESAVSPGEKKLYALAAGDPPTPLGSVYLKKDGSIVVTSSDGSGNAKATVTMAADGSVTINSQKITLTGGELDVNGTVTPGSSGPFCGLPNCIFSGAPHLGSKVEGT
jgi:hypothetical protein